MCIAPEILVADDTALVRWAVRRALSGRGFGIFEAENRSQVLEALISHSFRVIVLSLALVGDDMEDIARAIASSARNTGLIVLTENGVMPEALRSHARIKALDKPFSVTELVAAALTLARPDIEPPTESMSV